MPYCTEKLLQTRDLRDLPRFHIHLVMAMRLSVIASRNGQDPVELLSVRFGSIPAARSLLKLVRLFGEIWPDAFTISRPCCSRLTPDETLVAQLMAAVQQGSEAQFERHLGDMIARRHHRPAYRALAHFAGELEMALMARG